MVAMNLHTMGYITTTQNHPHHHPVDIVEEVY
jgi:hypothetical protein